MRHVSRVLATALALLAMAVGGGCGPGVYDAKGVPILVPTCTGDTPLYCASTNSCYAEDITHCGPACNECPAIPNANVFCDVASADPTLHACSFTCNPGFVFDGVGACVCAAGTNACSGATTCSPETPTSCGSGCVACPVPAHSAATCTNGQCGFTCDTANGFVPDNAGGCACPAGTNVCGGAASCARETTASCGPNCVDCAKTTPVGALPTCTAGKCGFACDTANGFVSDGAGGCTCALGSNSCGHPATCVADTPTVCGASCTPCSAPPHSSATCSNATCGFQCAPTFVSTGGVCICPLNTNICLTETTCNPETPARCGPNCSACTAPAHASPTCTTGACGFACNPSFVSDGAGGCVCPLGSNACGAATTCSAETPAACGPNCVACTAPAHASPTCTTGQCGFTCNPTFVSDGAGACICPAGQNACGGATTCSNETAAACGPNCAVCPTPANGSPVCTANHTCGVSCNPGYVPDATGTQCVCAPGTVACGAVVPPPGSGKACIADSTTACGPTCVTCTTNVANAAATCNVATQTCDFKCNTGFDLVGGNCVCPAGTCVHAGQTTCAAEDALGCGPTCQACTSPANGSAICNIAHQCDYVCNANFVKCTTGCCPPTPATCNPGATPPTVPCGAGGSCVTESATACGVTCAVCTAPANATAICDPASHVCDFTCNAGLFKHNGGCVPLASSATPLPPPATTGTFGQATVALGGRHSCAILADGGVVCWGANDQGQLGAGTRTVVPGHPIDIVLPANAVALTAGDAHTCAALNDGTVYCWGSNAKDQLGQLQSLASSSSPVQVPGLGSVAGFGTILAAGSNHTCAISGGAVKCWGDNALGQLGAGTAGPPTPTVTPTLITTGAIAIAAGGDHTCAIVASRAVQCWGANDFGQLGNGVPVPPAQTFQATPTTIVLSGKDPANQPLGTGALSIAAGRQHTCVISSGAGGVCWGRENELQIAARNMTTQGVPYNADKISTTKSSLVAAGGLHSCMSKETDLAPKCAGDAGTGQAPIAPLLGTCPVDLATPAGLMVWELFGGGSHNCVIVEPLPPPPAVPVGGVGPFSLYCWGVNDAGQLGNGSTLATTTAVMQVVIGQ